MIEAECRPIRRSYLDDRFELFGKEAIVEYVDALTGGPVWDTVRDRDRIDLVWLRPDRGLAKRLLKEPGWSVLYRDKVSILFSRRDGVISPRPMGGWTAEPGRSAGLGSALSFSRTALISSSGKGIVHSLTWPGRAWKRPRTSRQSGFRDRDTRRVAIWRELQDSVGLPIDDR